MKPLDAVSILESARAEDRRRIAELEEIIANCGFIEQERDKLRGECAAATSRAAELGRELASVRKELAETEEMRRDTHAEFVRLTKSHVCEPLTEGELCKMVTDWQSRERFRTINPRPSVKSISSSSFLALARSSASLQRAKCAAAKPQPAGKEEG